MKKFLSLAAVCALFSFNQTFASEPDFISPLGIPEGMEPVEVHEYVEGVSLAPLGFLFSDTRTGGTTYYFRAPATIYVEAYSGSSNSIWQLSQGSIAGNPVYGVGIGTIVNRSPWPGSQSTMVDWVLSFSHYNPNSSLTYTLNVYGYDD